MSRVPLACSLLALSVLACSGPRAAPKLGATDTARVSSWTPGDEVDSKDAALSFSFDRNMVSAEEVGPVLATPPVQIEPATALRVHWQDRQTLIVQPETEWRTGQRYALTLQGKQLAQLLPPPSFRFDVLPLRLQSTTLSRRNESHTPEFYAYFSLPLNPDDVVAHCTLRAPDGKRTALVIAPARHDTPAAGPTNQVRLRAREPLALSTAYEIDCPELTPAAGGAPLRADSKTASFTTHGLLTFAKGWPQQGVPLPPEKAELCLELSTPVNLDELAKHVHIDPPPEGLADGWYEGRCDRERVRTDDEQEATATHRTNSVLLAARRAYKVSVDAELTDVFGQQLGKRESWSFSTADRIPGVWTATGSGSVLEYGRKGHALGALNLATAELSCVELSPTQLAQSFDKISTWVSQSDDVSAEDRTQAPWQELSLTPRVHVLDASAAPNAARNVPLDLGGQCGTASGRAGVYALELTPRADDIAKLGRQGDSPARLLANVTDLGVIAKRGASSALVWVTRLSSGACVADAAIELLDTSGRKLAAARTDATGLARFTALRGSTQGELFSVRSGEDVAVVGTDWQWSEGVRPWQLGVREGSDDDVQLFVHTDRGVYRPGEHVFVHGLVRRVRDNAPASVPKQRDLHLLLSDGDEPLFERTQKLTDFGSFSAEIPLPPQLSPGTHSLRIDVAGKTESHPIQVAEFRPLRFELTGGPNTDEVLAGQEIKLENAARYLFGSPVSGADFRFTVERSPGRVRAPDLEAFRFEDDAPLLPDEQPWPTTNEGLAEEKDLKADAEGRAQFTFRAEASRRPTRYQFTVSATDAAQDRAARSFSVLAHSAERYVGTHLARFVIGAGESVQAELVVIDRNGKRVAGDADVELRHTRWECRDPLEGCRAEVRVLEKQHVHVLADKPTPVTFATSAPGRVDIRATTRDAQGRQARASDTGYVWSSESSGPYNDRVAATLSVDRRAYHIGDRARLALQSPLSPAFLLVTAERGDLLSASVVPRASGLPSIELADWSAPNTFLSVAGMTPRAAPGEAGKPRLVAGAHEVSVLGPSRVLQVAIEPARARYQPHERVEGAVLVTHLGRPVVAEVALVAVNESVLQLTGFETPDPTRVFHEPRGLRVRTFSNITRVLGDPSLAAAVPETARIGTPGEDGEAGKPDLRDDYVAAAYVAPHLHTDANGRAVFAFEAPTDLSAYRLMAVVAAKDDRVGSADARVTVSQPLAASVVAPRFVSRADTLELGALIHDTSEQPGETDVRFSADGLALDQPSAHVTANPAGALVRTRAFVADVDNAFFEVELHKGEHKDRVRRALQVRRPLDTDLRVLALGRNDKTRVRLDWPKGIEPKLSKLEITVDRAGLAPLAPVLAMVLDYPYGCTEQTAAALSALAAAPELARAIVPGLATPAQWQARFDEGFARLLKARTSDGQFALYPGMGGRIWLTALVVEAGLAAREARMHTPEALTGEPAKLLLQWLSEQDVRKLAPLELEHAAQIAWLLARLSLLPAGSIERLLTRSAALSVSATAYLLHAAALAKSPEALRAPLRAQLTAAKWQTRLRDPEDPLTSAARTGALILLALEADAAAPERRAELAHWLIARAADPAAYLSTRDVAETLSALATWANGVQAGAGAVRIGLGDQPLWSGPLTGAQVVALSRDAASTKPGDVWVEADGAVSVSIRRRDVAVSAPKPAFSHGLSLERRYLQPGTRTARKQLALGDVVQVELELRSDRPLRMLALTDPLPAGLEPMDPGLSSGQLGGCETCNDVANFDHVRRHDDHLEAFVEWLPPGKHVLRYLLRATTAGDFSAPGATAGLMYMPDYFARSGVDRISVRRDH